MGESAQAPGDGFGGEELGIAVVEGAGVVGVDEGDDAAAPFVRIAGVGDEGNGEGVAGDVEREDGDAVGGTWFGLGGEFVDGIHVLDGRVCVEVEVEGEVGVCFSGPAVGDVGGEEDDIAGEELYGGVERFPPDPAFAADEEDEFKVVNEAFLGGGRARGCSDNGADGEAWPDGEGRIRDGNGDGRGGVVAGGDL